MWVPTTTMLIAMMEQSIGNSTIGPLGDSSMALLSAPFAPRADLTFADLQEATYDGYVRQNPAFQSNDISIGQNGKALALGGPLVWQPSGSTSPNTIYGHALINGGSVSPTLMAAEAFDTPIPLTGPLTLIVDVAWFGLDPSANYGLSGISI